jgi:hypothetical protein
MLRTPSPTEIARFCPIGLPYSWPAERTNSRRGESAVKRSRIASSPISGDATEKLGADRCRCQASHDGGGIIARDGRDAVAYNDPERQQ